MSLLRTVRLGAWEFFITQETSGLYVSVPDCGGMADSVPRDADQLAWAESAFAELPALKQIWPTTWELPAESLGDLEALFERRGGRW